METAIRNQFLEQNIDLRGGQDDSIVMKGAELCRRFALTAEDLVMKWMAHIHNTQYEGAPTVALLEEIKKGLEKSEKRSKKSLTHPAPATQGSFDQSNIGAMFSDDFADAFGVDAGELGGGTVVEDEESKSVFKTPARGAARRTAPGGLAGLATPQSATKEASPATANKDYHNRQNAGKVELTYNPQSRDIATKDLKHPTELGIGAFEGPKKYRYMFQKLRDMSDVIDERIDVLGERITKRHGLLKSLDKDGNEVVSSLAHVAMPNQEEVTIVGRVCLDAAGEGKLNAKSVKLEGSRVTSNGARVELNLDATQTFSVFPGQVVACTGTNSTGTQFTPSVVYQGAAYPMYRTPPEEFLEHYFAGTDEGTQVVDIMVAAGPYTTSADLSYAPLDDLLDVIKRDTPDVVVLLGPFVDENHPIIKNAEMDVSYETLFQHVVEKICEGVLPHTEHTELIFVPSLKDVHHDSVYPQPAFTLPVAMENERVHCMANPATIMIKEITIGVSTTDTLMDLSKQETSRGQSGDRMGRLANHILDQRSYYPLLPPAPGVNLEYEQLSHINLPKITPDIMLMPSELRYFVKNVNGSLVVNPGRMTRHTSGGTYSKISVHAPRRNDIPEAGRLLHNIHDRSVVQVIRV